MLFPVVSIWAQSGARRTQSIKELEREARPSWESSLGEPFGTVIAWSCSGAGGRGSPVHGSTWPGTAGSRRTPGHESRHPRLTLEEPRQPMSQGDT